MDLANMRQNGVRSLDVQCNQCRHRVIVNVDHLPGDVTVPSFGPRMVCTKCGTIGADVRPNWKEQPPRESRTDKQWRDQWAGHRWNRGRNQRPHPSNTAGPSTNRGHASEAAGPVEAPDEESANKQAIEEFGITPQLQKRLLAQRRP
jgi:hypothetical protein